ncbi:MAG: hypothetical protein HOV80_17745 [Polyangiaceae bacterium]|nr:hypothetical protein [Polyangiaceae bacterium]
MAEGDNDPFDAHVRDWEEKARVAAEARHRARRKEAEALVLSKGSSADVRKAEATKESSALELEADLAKIAADAALFRVKREIKEEV